MMHRALGSPSSSASVRGSSSIWKTSAEKAVLALVPGDGAVGTVPCDAGSRSDLLPRPERDRGDRGEWRRGEREREREREPEPERESLRRGVALCESSAARARPLAERDRLRV